MVMQKETHTVSSYNSATSRVEELFDYPGSRPECSYVTDGNVVEILPDTYAEFYEEANNILRKKCVPGMDERIPLLSYGANAAPHRLKEKMAKFKTPEEIQSELQTVPHCKAIVKDSVAGWHGRPGQTGSVFAELIKNDDTAGIDLRAHIAFVIKEQLALISESEGVTYSLAEIEVLAGKDEVPMTVLSYVALDATIRIENGQPVAVDKIPHISDRPIHSDSAINIVEKMLEEADYPIRNPEQFAAAGLLMTLNDKKARQATVGQALVDAGTRQAYEYPTKKGNLVGRVDFTSIPHIGVHDQLIVLPEELLSRIRPSDKQIIEKMDQLRSLNPGLNDDDLRIKALNTLDPVRRLSRRAHDELKTHLAKQEIDK